MPATVPESRPFRPGESPVFLAGRGDVRAELNDLVDLLGQLWRPLILEGPRGVGKTSLIEWADQSIANAGSLHIKLEARPGESLFDLLARWITENAALMAEFGISPSTGGATTDIELNVAPVRIKRSSSKVTAETPNTASGALLPILDALGQRQSGVVISVDEAQVGGVPLMLEISSLLTSARNGRWHLGFLIAGLPTLRDQITPNRQNKGSLGQLERAAWYAIDAHLSLGETTQAISEPLRQLGISISSDAIESIYGLTAGYPYAVQLLGHAIWSASSPRTTTIDLPQVLSAERLFQKSLRDSLLISRWRQLSEQERTYAAAMARILGDGVTTNADVARSLGKQPSETTYLRQRLLDKGLLVKNDLHPRQMAFIVPPLAAFILEQLERDE